MKILIGIIILLILVFTVPIPTREDTYCTMLNNIFSDCRSISTKWVLSDPLWKRIINQYYLSKSIAAPEYFCGSIFGLVCPNGYKCKMDNHYPDADGKCVKKFLNLF